MQEAIADGERHGRGDGNEYDIFQSKKETIAIETPTRQIALPDFNDWARGIVFDGLPNDSTNNANLESTTEISVPSSEGEAVQRAIKILVTALKLK